jgi:hypothetical protein
MGNSAESINRCPQAHCNFCEAMTPHRHERLAVRGAQVARSVCLVCDKERGGDRESNRLKDSIG